MIRWFRLAIFGITNDDAGDVAMGPVPDETSGQRIRQRDRSGRVTDDGFMPPTVGELPCGSMFVDYGIR